MQKIRLLIADSTASLRQFMKYALEDHFPHIVIEMANNGKNIQQRLEAARYDLILYESEMPGLDGFAVLEWLRNHDALKNIPFILMSPSRDEENLRKAIRLDADGYLLKPFKAENLIGSVTKALNSPHRKKNVRYRVDGSITVRSGASTFRGSLFDIGAEGVSCIIERQEHIPHILEEVEADIEVLNRARIENVPGYIVRLEAVGSSPETAQIRITLKFRAEHAPVKLEEITGVLSALEQS